MFYVEHSKIPGPNCSKEVVNQGFIKSSYFLIKQGFFVYNTFKNVMFHCYLIVSLVLKTGC